MMACIKVITLILVVKNSDDIEPPALWSPPLYGSWVRGQTLGRASTVDGISSASPYGLGFRGESWGLQASGIVGLGWLPGREKVRRILALYRYWAITAVPTWGGWVRL